MKITTLCLVVATTAALCLANAPRAEEQALSTGFAETSLGSKVYWEVHGNEKGPNVFMTYLNPSLEPHRAELEAHVALLGDRYRLLFADYPVGLGRSDAVEHASRTTADQVARDYLAIADAAGMQRFAIVGYSWSANASLQVAVRTDRIDALVMGGWPALGGPYDASLATVTAIAEDAEGMDEIPGVNGPPSVYWQQFVAYYRSLQDWPEREAVEHLSGPRLNFSDEDDVIEFAGISQDLVGILREHQPTLEKLGWEVAYVTSGSGHMGGSSAKVAGPLIAAFLDKNLLSKD